MRRYGFFWELESDAGEGLDLAVSVVEAAEPLFVSLVALLSDFCSPLELSEELSDFPLDFVSDFSSDFCPFLA